MKHTPGPSVPVGRRVLVGAVVALAIAGILALLLGGNPRSESVEIFDSSGQPLALAAHAEPICVASGGQIGVLLDPTGYTKTNEELHAESGVDAWLDGQPVGFVDADAVPDMHNSLPVLPLCEDTIEYGLPPSQ